MIPKFRVWDNENQKYFNKTSVSAFMDSNGDLYMMDDGLLFCQENLIPEFSTGLHDADGKDLGWWEGDKFKDGGCTKKIEFKGGAFYLQCEKNETHRILLSECISWPLEKVGTIHD